MLGYLYRPAGKGPFPAVVFHHRDHKSLMSGNMSQLQKLADFFTTSGYMLFMPDRHTDTFSNDEFSPTLQQGLRNKSREQAVIDQYIIERMEIVNRDIVASAQWLRQQPDVKTNEIAIVGMFGGAMQSLIALEKINVRTCVLFSPATSTWRDSHFRQGWLLTSIRKSTAPIFLIYTQDQNPEPAEALGREVENKGKPSRTKVYPGLPPESSPNFAIDGIDIWGPDVLSFLKETMR